MTIILNGKEVADKMLEDLAEKTAQMKRKPKLLIVSVGEDQASKVYVNNKIKAGEKAGIDVEHMQLRKDLPQFDLDIILINASNNDDLDGIILQLPLPDHLDAREALEQISIDKDVDGFSYEAVGRLHTGDEDYAPCTPAGIIQLLKFYDLEKELRGKTATVIGRSDIVGKPIAKLLMDRGATVTIAHSQTHNLREACKNADIVVAAIGQAKMIDASYIKDGAIVIDVGINRDSNGKLCGDVDFEQVVDKVKAITPVPKGVGPMTVATLMKKTYEFAKNQD